MPTFKITEPCLLTTISHPILERTQRTLSLMATSLEKVNIQYSSLHCSGQLDVPPSSPNLPSVGADPRREGWYSRHPNPIVVQQQPWPGSSSPPAEWSKYFTAASPPASPPHTHRPIFAKFGPDQAPNKHQDQRERGTASLISTGKQKRANKRMICGG